MATVQRYVNTASTAGGDGTTNATAGANRAYASLSEWEAGVAGAATDDYIVDCCGTAADTTATVVNFATHITTGSVLIRGNRSDGAGFYTGANVISTSHYRLVPASGNPLDIRETKVTIDGIQIESAGGANAAGIYYGSGPSGMTFTVKNCRIRAASATDQGIGTGSSTVSSSGTFIFQNNLVVGFNLAGIDVNPSNFFNPTCNIYQNTVYMDGSGIGIQVVEGGGNGGTYNIKGNAIANSGASNCFAVTLNTGTANYDDNATEDAQGTNGEIAIGVLTDAWTSPGTTQGSQFTVKNTSSTLYNAVNPTLVTTDITDFTRDGTNHDVGAFELQAAASFNAAWARSANSAHGSGARTG